MYAKSEDGLEWICAICEEPYEDQAEAEECCQDAAALLLASIRDQQPAPDAIEGVLRAAGFGGLYHPDPDLHCGCLLDELAPCDMGNSIPSECQPGYRSECDCGEGCSWHVGPLEVK